MRRTSFRTTNKFILLQYIVPSLLPAKSSYFFCRCHCWQWCLAIGRNALRFERLRRGLWLWGLLQYTVVLSCSQTGHASLKNEIRCVMGGDRTHSHHTEYIFSFFTAKLIPEINSRYQLFYFPLLQYSEK